MVNRHISGILSRGAKVVRSFVRDAAKSGKERRKGFPFWTIKTELARSLAQPHSNELESTEGTTGATEIEAGKNGSTHVQCLWPESQANQSLQTKKLFTYV